MAKPDLTLNTEASRLEVFGPSESPEMPAHIYVRETNLGLDLTESEAHLLARTIAPEIVLATGKEHPKVYERAAQDVLNELNEAVESSQMSVTLRAKLTSVKLSLRLIARGEISE